MRYVKVNTLSILEEDMRYFLQDKYNEMQEYKSVERIATEWNMCMLFADFLVRPKKWAVRAGVVILMEEAD